MKYHIRFIVFILLLLSTPSMGLAQAQKFMKYHIATLAGPSMEGRGYVKKGHEKAARWLQRKFSDFGLKPLKDTAFLQPFIMSVNTFPDTVEVKLGKKTYVPGKEYLVVASSNGFRKNKFKLQRLDLRKFADSMAFYKWATSADAYNKGYWVKGVDSFLKKSGLTKRILYRSLPKGFYVMPQKNKLIWTVARDTMAATIIQLPDSLIKKPKKASAIIENKLEPGLRCYNVMGYVPGTQYPDSFIVFTAHYDHLGMMGKSTEFPGASDNASGTSAMLYLAQYYAQNPQKYSIAFMAFGGEEAGLVGSKHYVDHPRFPLGSIKWLTNLDIMGSAEDGISVVNGKVLPNQFAVLDSINKAKAYLPKIVQGEKASNSDHHYFYEAGVPAIFIFTRGGPGHYHDVYDKPNTLPLTNLDKVMDLIIDFTAHIQLP